MKKRFFYFLYFFSIALFVFSFGCKKDSIPNTITGKWKLILQGNDNAAHRIDTFALTHTSDTLQEFLTFNTDDSTGILRLVGLGLDSDNVYSQMDSSYRFSWIYFNDGPEIWITLKENPKRRFHVWTDSANVHLHINYQDPVFFCNYFYDLGGASHQQVFQKQ